VLTEAQSARLARRFTKDFADCEFAQPATDQLELGYTSEQIRPWVENWTASLKQPQLLVRGDGGAPATALMLGDMQFYPDVEILEFDKKHVAVEVKLLRSNDGTGSLTKALGQSVIYRTLGFDTVHVALIDVRGTHIQERELPDWSLMNASGIFIHWFRPVKTPTGVQMRCTKSATA
jgi:hypothetical protein